MTTVSRAMPRMYETLPLEFNAAAHFLGLNLSAGRTDKTAVFHPGGSLTYGELFELVRRVAGMIGECGVQTEQRVALLLPDSPELFAAFWGILWRGAVAVPLNVAAKAADLRYELADCRARLLVTTADLLRRIGEPDAPALQEVLLVDETCSFQQRLVSAKVAETPAATHRDEPAFWLYTSGTTGRPKAAVHAHHHMVACAEYYGVRTLGLREADVNYSVASIPFAYGLGALLYMPMAVGASAVLTAAKGPYDIVADVGRYRPTVFWGIPSIYAALLSIDPISPLDGSSLRLCVSAAEQLPATVWEAFKERHGIEICEGIGTTEMLHVFISNRPGDCKPGFSGRPVPGYDVRVVDEQGVDVRPGEAGDLEVSGETLMLGYWNRYTETRNALHGFTMKTGDRYFVSEDGYYRFVGRADDLLKIDGMWVSPLEVENVLLTHPAVSGSAVVTEPAESGGIPRLVAYLTLRTEAKAAPEVGDILSFVKSRLPHFMAPRKVCFVAEIPRTATGKIDRSSLRRSAEGGLHNETRMPAV